MFTSISIKEKTVGEFIGELKYRSSWFSDEGYAAAGETDGASLQDNLGPNPPSFAEVS